MMIKQLSALLLSAFMALPLGATGEAVIDTELEGYVTEVMEDGFIMEDKALGQIMLNVDEATVLDGVLLESGIEPGLYVIVTYDGRTTRSIPPQAHADKVGCYVLNGVVGEFSETGFMLTGDELFGDVLVHTEGSDKHLYPGVPVTVYYDGVMAMSLPGQVAAREIVVPELTGTASQLDLEGFTLTDAEGATYRVAITDETLIGELVAAQAEDPAEEGKADGGAADESQTDDPQADESAETPDAASQATAPADETDEVAPSAPVALITHFETINYDRALQEGDQVIVYYNGELTEGELTGVTALEVLAIMENEA